MELAAASPRSHHVHAWLGIGRNCPCGLGTACRRSARSDTAQSSLSRTCACTSGQPPARAQLKACVYANCERSWKTGTPHRLCVISDLELSRCVRVGVHAYVYACERCRPSSSSSRARGSTGAYLIDPARPKRHLRIYSAWPPPAAAPSRCRAGLAVGRPSLVGAAANRKAAMRCFGGVMQTCKCKWLSCNTQCSRTPASPILRCGPAGT